MNAKKLVVLVVVAFLLFFLITQPVLSATATHNVLGWLGNGAAAIVTFLKSLFSQSTDAAVREGRCGRLFGCLGLAVLRVAQV
jgi:hypothetical protein